MVGVDEEINEDKPTFTLFPNPAKINTNISFSSSGGNYQLQIINLTGSTVFQTEEIFFPEGNQGFELRLNDLKKGMYFVSLRNGNKATKTQRLIIL